MANKTIHCENLLRPRTNDTTYLSESEVFRNSSAQISYYGDYNGNTSLACNTEPLPRTTTKKETNMK